MNRPSRPRSALLLGLLASLSCTSTVEVPDPVTLRLEIATGGTGLTQQVNTLAAAVPTVRVVDGAGAPVASVRVVYLVTRGGGTVGTTDVFTDASGIASPVSWRYGTRAGAQQVSAAIVSATADARATFDGTATPGPTTTIGVDPASIALRVGGTRTITASTVDAYGNPTAGGPTATFTSLAPGIATVSNAGLVTAVSPGATTIRVSVGAVLRDIPVSVGDRPTGLNVTSTALGNDPYGVAVREDGLIYVTRGLATSLSRLQMPGDVVLGTIPTNAGRTTDVVFVPGLQRAYTANIDILAVSIINTSTHTLLRTVPVGEELLRVKASPAGDYVFASSTAGSIKRFNTADDSVTTLALAGPINGLAVNPVRGVLYATNYSGTFYEISIATFTLLRSVSLSGTLQGIAVSPDGSRIFVAAEGVGTRELDAASLASGSAFGPTGAFDVAVTNDGNEVYISDSGGGLVSVHDAFTRALIRTHSIPSPRRIAFSPDGLAALVASQGGSVWFIR
jgi:hypothetical protein